MSRIDRLQSSAAFVAIALQLMGCEGENAEAASSALPGATAPASGSMAASGGATGTGALPTGGVGDAPAASEGAGDAAPAGSGSEQGQGGDAAALPADSPTASSPAGGSPSTGGSSQGGAMPSGGVGGAPAPMGGAPTGGVPATAGGGGTPAPGGSGGQPAGGGGGGEAPVVVEVDLADSVPAPYRQPAAQSGEMVKRSYDCYHYTDETAGLETEPSNLVLQRRDQPLTKQLNVYLPPGYDSGERYPVAYVLHGLTDNEDTWLERGDPHPALLLDNLISRGDIRPIVAVFPNGNSSSSYLERTFQNQAGYYYFANELVNDILPFVEAEYSVATSRSSRAIAGFSMGGMQTINAGLCQSLEHFAWFGAFAAAPTTYTADRIAEYLADQNASASLPVHFFYNICGASDDTSESHVPAIDGLAELSDQVSDANLVYHEVPGSHDYSVSSVGLYNFLRIAFGN